MAFLDNPGNGLISGRKTVTTAGTRVQLVTTTTEILTVAITAETDNTNPVTVGGSDVVGALATRKGIPLTAGNSVTLSVRDLSDVYIDAVTDTEGVTYLAVTV